MHVDAVGTAIDLRHAQVNKVHERLRQAGLGDVAVNTAKRLHAVGGDGGIVETLGHRWVLILAQTPGSRFATAVRACSSRHR